MRIPGPVLLLCVLNLLFWVVTANDVDLSLDFEQSILTTSNAAEEEVWRPRAGKVRYIVNKAEKKLSVKFETPQFKLESGDLEKLKTGWMRVRMPAVNSNGEAIPGKYLITSIKGCSLIQDPKEVFSLMTDKTGALMGLQYDRPLLSECDVSKPVPNELDVTSKIVAALPKEASSLPLPKIDPDSIVQGDGKQKEQPQAQGFLQQYWYIILPSIVLYTLLTAPGAGPEPSAAVATAAGSVAASASTTAAGTLEGGSKKRRPQ